MIAGGRFHIKAREKDTWRIWIVGDIHLGNRACSLNRFRRTVQRIKKDPHAIWIGMGDYAEYIGYQDSRFDPNIADPDMTIRDLGQLGSYLRDKVCEEMDPIKHKCVGLLMGNHELSYMKNTSAWNLHSELCKSLGVRDLGYSCFIDFIFNTEKNRHRVKFAGHHGSGHAITTGGKLNRLKAFMNMFPNVDIFAMGHVHEKLQYARPIITTDNACKKLLADEQLGVCCGSYLKTYGEGPPTYGEVRGYESTILGSVAITIELATRELGVVW